MSRQKATKNSAQTAQPDVVLRFDILRHALVREWIECYETLATRLRELPWWPMRFDND
jgi:hypothetical protein